MTGLTKFASGQYQTNNFGLRDTSPQISTNPFLNILKRHVTELGGVSNDRVRGTVYRLGAGHGTIYSAFSYRSMDCSSYVSQMLARFFGVSHTVAKTTTGLYANPHGLRQTNLPINDLRNGEVVQFVWKGGGSKANGHTGFLFMENGRLKVLDFRGGSKRCLVYGEGDSMFDLAMRRNAKFFVVSKTANGGFNRYSNSSASQSYTPLNTPLTSFANTYSNSAFSSPFAFFTSSDNSSPAFTFTPNPALVVKPRSSFPSLSQQYSPAGSWA